MTSPELHAAPCGCTPTAPGRPVAHSDRCRKQRSRTRKNDAVPRLSVVDGDGQPATVDAAGELALLAGRLAELSGTVVTLITDLEPDHVQARIEQSEARRDLAEAHARTLELRCQDAEQALAAVEGRVESVAAQLNQRGETLSETRAELAQAQTDVLAATARAEGAETSLDQTLVQVQDLEGQVGQLRQELKDSSFLVQVCENERDQAHRDLARTVAAAEQAAAVAAGEAQVAAQRLADAEQRARAAEARAEAAEERSVAAQDRVVAAEDRAARAERELALSLERALATVLAGHADSADR